MMASFVLDTKPRLMTQADQPVAQAPLAGLRLSIVAPCYNEVGSLPTFVSRAEEAAKAHVGESFELILVNDGSRDATWSVIEALSQSLSNVVGVDRTRNHGHQLAV